MTLSRPVWFSSDEIRSPLRRLGAEHREEVGRHVRPGDAFGLLPPVKLKLSVLNAATVSKLCV